MAKCLLYSLLVVAAVYQIAHGKTYTSQDYGYSLELPDSWVQIPDKLFQEVMKSLAEGDEPTIYDAAFQAADTESVYGYPRVELGFVPYAKVGFIQQATKSEMQGLAEGIAKMNSAKLRVITDGNQEPDLSSLDIVTLDLPNHRITWCTETEVDEEPTLCHAQMAFGKRGWVNATYWVRKDKATNTAEVWKQFARSLQFGLNDRYYVAAAPTNPNGETYTSATYGYSAHLPAGWQQLPDDVLQGMVSEVVKAANNPTIFDAGFMPGDSMFGFPRIMFGVIPYPKMGIYRQMTEDEISKLASQFTGLSASEVKDMTTRRMPKEVADSMDVQGMGGTSLDMQNHRLVWLIDTEMSGEPCIGYCVMLFGRESCVTAGFWYRKKDSAGVESIKSKLTSSLRFTPQYAYSVPLSDRQTPPPWWQEPLENGLVRAALSVLFLGAISFAFHVINGIGKKKESPPKQESKTPPQPQPPKATTPPPLPPVRSPSARAICGNCGGRFKAPAEAIGKRTKCPKCGTEMEVQAKAV